MTPEEIQQLQDALNQNRQHGHDGDTWANRPKLDPEELSGTVERCVVTTSEHQRTMHLKDADSPWDDPENACNANVFFDSEWTSKDMGQLNGAWSWCLECRVIGHERHG